MFLALDFDPELSDIEREKLDEEVQIVTSSGSTKKVLWPDNETKADCTGPHVVSKSLMLKSNFFNSIGMRVEHAVDSVTSSIHFTFKTTTIFVTENNL